MIQRALQSLAVTLVLAAAGASLGPAIAAAGPTDVLFVVDTTGSMDDALDDARDEMTDSLTSIAAQVPDVQFGVAEVRDYPDSYGDAGDEPFSVAQPITASRSAVTDTIDDLVADGGGDNPESYGRALYESGVSAAPGWRPGARRLIVLVADDVPHDLDLNRSVPAADLTHSTPWDTGADPGRDDDIGTADDLAWLDVLARLQRDAVPLLFVFYHGDEDYLPYWRYWAGLTGGEVSAVGVGGATGTLGGEVAAIVARNAPPCAPSLAGPPQPASGRTAQAGVAATTVTLGAPAGTRFCIGTKVQFGGTDADVSIAAGGATLTAAVPRKAGQDMSVTLPGVAAPVGVPFAVDNYRYPYGFQFGNTSNFLKNGGNTVTTADLAAVFGEDAVYLSIPAITGSCRTCLISQAGSLLLAQAQNVASGMCFGMSIATMRFFHGDRKLAEFGAAPTVTALPVPTERPSDSAVWRFVRQQQISQIAVQIHNAENGAKVTTAAAIRERLRAAFAAGDRPLVELSFQLHGERDGHALIAYDVEDRDGGFEIDVYDPNVASEGDFLDAAKRGQQFDTLKVRVGSDGRWTYTGSFDHGRFGDPIGGGAADLRVLAHSTLPARGLRSPVAWADGLLSLSALGAILRQVIGAANHTLLAPDGSVKPDAATALPGVELLPAAVDPGTGTELKLGGRGPYRLVLEARPGGGEIEQSFAGSQTMGAVKIARPAAGSRYEITASPRTVGVKPGAGTVASTLTLLKHMRSGADRSVTARLQKTSGRTSVSFDGSGASVTVSATSDVRGTVTLSQANGGGLPSSATVAVVARKGERVVLRPRAWSRLTRIVASRRAKSGRIRSRRVVVRRAPGRVVHLGRVRATGRGGQLKLRVPYRVQAKPGDVTLMSYVVRRGGRVLTRGSRVLKAKRGTVLRTLRVGRWRRAIVQVRLTRVTGGRTPASVQARKVVRVRAG